MERGETRVVLPGMPQKAEEEISIKWSPSIHMPREAARIFLRVTDVRVEPLRDITKEDLVRDFCLC